MEAAENIGKQNSLWDFKGELSYVDDWYLMGTPAPVILITIFYLLFVLKIGPYYMKNKKPFNLDNTLIIYNGVQVLISLVLGVFCLRELLSAGFIDKSCLYSTEESKRPLANVMHSYFILKIVEYLDTVFFVLRKKQNQVTFLHTYHHTYITLASWSAVKYEPTPVTMFLGALNCFVHVVMYLYYALTVFPGLRRYLWWKRYITRIQLIQFIAIVGHSSLNSFASECKLSRVYMCNMYINGVIFVYLFSNFYIKSYLKKKNIKAQMNNEEQSIAAKETHFSDINKYNKVTNVNDSFNKFALNGKTRKGVYMRNVAGK